MGKVKKMGKVFNCILRVMALVLLSSCIQGEAKMKDEVVKPTKETPAEFTIVSDGKPTATIVIGEKATSVEEFAAEELQKYVRKMSGASLPIVKDDEKGIKGNLILIGRGNTNKKIEKLDIDTEQLKEDGFIIKRVKNNLIISGSNNRGTLFGVYDFLEDDLGCLFFQLWEVVPEKPTIEVGKINRAEEPDFKIRGRNQCYPSCVDPQTKLKANWLKVTRKERWDNEKYMGAKVDDSKSSDPRYHYYNEFAKLWKERGFIIAFAAHTFGYFLSPERYFEEHPEYFSLIDGKRVRGKWLGERALLFGTQICWSNPDAVKEVTKNVLEFIKKYPEVDEIIVSPNDFDGFCECEKCLSLESGKKSVWENNLCYSRGYALFLNKIAEEVHKYYPEKRIGSSIYRVVTDPPDNVEISKYVTPVVAIPNRDFSRPINDPSGKGTRFVSGGYKKVIEGWTKLSSNVVLIEYYYGSARSILMGIPAWSILFKEYPYFKKIGVAGIVSPDDGPFSVFLTNYVSYRLGWDCNDEVLNNFCVKSFGKAAEPMRRYLDIIGKMMERQDPGLLNTNPDMIKMWSLEKDAVQSAKDCLKEAKAMVKGDKKILHRIRFVERDLYFSSLIGAGYRLYMEGQGALKDKDYKKASELFQLSIDNYRKAPRFHHYGPKGALKYLEKNYINQSMQNLKLSEVLMKSGNSKQEEPNIVINPSAEKIKAGETKKYIGAIEYITQDAPENWGVYLNTGKISWGSTTKESHSGERSAFLETRGFSKKGNVNAALIVGKSWGHKGYDTYPALPNTCYRFSFWIKTDFSRIAYNRVPSVTIYALTWTTEEAESKDRKYILASKPHRITPSSEWQKHDGVFTTSADTKKFVLYLKMTANENKGNLGKIYVDDVYVAPIKDITGQKKIAVYNPDIDGGKCYGKTAILSTLVNAEGFQPEFITDLSLKNLLQYDCLIFPGVKKLGKSQINSSWVENIREYVIKHGKGAMFQHDSCGYAPHNWILGDTTVFPEVCKGVKVKTGTRPGTEGNKEGKRLIVNAIHSLTEGYKVGDKASHAFWDHMALLKGEEGEIILTDKNKDPVVLAGKIGKGRVVFDGTVPSDEKTGEVEIITGIEKDILINSINWFCEKLSDE